MNNHVYTSIGASNHSEGEREPNDYYATEPRAVELLTEIEDIKKVVFEPCCGEGHISKVLWNKGHLVYSSDLINRGFGVPERDLMNYKLMGGILWFMRIEKS